MAVLTPVRPCIPEAVTPESVTSEAFTPESIAVIRRMKGWRTVEVSAPMFIGKRRCAAAKQHHTHCRNQ
jgi:hypothetical protein